MPSVGEQLREARLAKKISIETIADLTKMRGDQVRALEDSNFAAFPAPVYIRGFVRSYANVLKLESPSLLKQLDAELSQNKLFHQEGSFGAPRGQFLDGLMLALSRLDWRIILPLAAVTALLAAGVTTYVIWKRESKKDPLRNLDPGLYQPPASMGETLPLTNAPAPSGR